MSQQEPQQSYPQGYQQQPMQQFPQVQRPREIIQEVRFYKSSMLGIASAVGRFQRDYQKMAGQGWKVKYFNIVGIDLFLRRYVVVVYER